MEGEMLADTYLSLPFIWVSRVSGLQYIGIHIYIGEAVQEYTYIADDDDDGYRTVPRQNTVQEYLPTEAAVWHAMLERTLLA